MTVSSLFQSYDRLSAPVILEEKLGCAHLGVVAVCPVEAGGHAAKHFYKSLAFLIRSKDYLLGTLMLEDDVLQATCFCNGIITYPRVMGSWSYC
jgi:hypothetical protein